MPFVETIKQAKAIKKTTNINHLQPRSESKMTKLSGQFRSTQWDPLLIIAQIIALQSVYYVCLGLWLAAVNLLVGTSRSLEHIFRYQVSF